MDEYLRFEIAIVCLSNCNFFRFSAPNLSLLLTFFTFLCLIMYLQLSIHTLYTELIKHLPPKFNVMFKFNYSKYKPRGLFFGGGGGGGGAYTWNEFSFQNLVTKRPGAYTRWGLLSEFYGIFFVVEFFG